MPGPTPLEVAAIRHHLRVWKTTETVGGEPFWVGSATHDNGFEKDQRNGGITHHIDANVDQERDFLEQSFAGAGVLAGAAYVMPSEPADDSENGHRRQLRIRWADRGDGFEMKPRVPRTQWTEEELLAAISPFCS